MNVRKKYKFITFFLIKINSVYIRIDFSRYFLQIEDNKGEK